jgi:hypothetical protein
MEAWAISDGNRTLPLAVAGDGHAPGLTRFQSFEIFVAAIILDRNSQVRLDKPMITAAIGKSQ